MHEYAKQNNALRFVYLRNEFASYLEYFTGIITKHVNARSLEP